jgi:hypothetical protein
VAFLKFLGLTIALPALAYWLIRHHLSVSTEGEELLAGFLGVGALLVFAIRNS